MAPRLAASTLEGMTTILNDAPRPPLSPDEDAIQAQIDDDWAELVARCERVR